MSVQDPHYCERCMSTQDFARLNDFEICCKQCGLPKRKPKTESKPSPQIGKGQLKG